MNIGIYIYDGAEVLDFAGPFEVFCTASRLAGKEGFNTWLIGETGDTIQARGGFLVTPHYSILNHPPLDVLVVVGGVHDAEMNKPEVFFWIAEVAAADCQIIASVCTGAFLLAGAGVLQDQTVTTHWEDIEQLRDSFPRLTVVENRRWVEGGKVITSAGISAGIDMSLYLVSRLRTKKLAEATARQMEFDWTLDSDDAG